MKSICVFCGSSSGVNTRYADMAAELASELAARRIRLVYGGASRGLMGELADRALEAGGEVVGVLPDAIADLEVAHSGLTELHRVSTMHERKALMARLSDAFVAMPGGFGTLDEVSEMLTWRQIGIHDKPVGIMNVAGYYDGLLEFLDRMVREGFASSEDRRRVCVGSTPEEVLDGLDEARGSGS